MKFSKLNTVHWFILAVLILLVTLCLTATTLFRFPAFYEGNPSQKTRTFLLTGLFFLILVVFTSTILLMPHIKSTLQKKNRLFSILMTILLTIILATTSANYWAVPEVHAMEICFDADEETGNLNILELVDPNTNRLYPPNSFGFNRYPIRVDSGKCLNGRIMMLISPLTQALIGYQVTASIEEGPPDGRLSIEINNKPSVVYFGQNAEPQDSNQIVLKDGFDNGTKYTEPWGRLWFIGLKLVAALISAIFIAIILSGLMEEIFSFPVQIDGRSNG